MKVIIMGPPGAGKGTQAERIVKKYNVPHISTGDMFRAAIKEGTEMGKKAKEYMDKGSLVPNEIVVGIVKDRLSEDDCKTGFLLDGFPRTLEQAEALSNVFSDLGINSDAVINIDVNLDELMERLTGRRVCRDCGNSYHIKFNPPKVRNVCDACGGELYQRDDDTAETVKSRLDVYEEQTQPLIDYYRDKGLLVNIDGNVHIDDVFKSVAEYLDKVK